MADKKAPNPATPSLAYEEMAPKWKQLDDLMGGTAAMRAAAFTYLPKHPQEEDTAYLERLNSTILYNVTELTRSSLVGRVFKEELRLNDDVPKELKALEENIDLQKNSIPTFCVEWFADGVLKGFSHVLVDMPSLSADQRANRTLADDVKENRRPFWSLIRPENLIFAYYEQIYGVPQLRQVRIVERVSELDESGLQEVWWTNIRVINIGTWEVWRDINENTKNRKPEWRIIDQGTYDLPVIPLITFYTGQKKGEMICKPPLEDLGYLNVRHWQSTSDQINVLTVARFPMLAASGAQVEAGKGTMKVGPRQLLTMRDPNGRFYYVEHSGKAIASGQAELDGLVDQMSAYGSEFLRRQIAGRTAFERAADGGEASSPLRRMALDFKAAVERALQMTALWLRTDPTKAGTVTVNLEFTEEDVVATDFNVLDKARERMDISRETFIKEMKRRGVIDTTIDVNEELARLKTESKAGPLTPSFFRASETIRATEAVAAGASAADVVDGKTKAAPAPAAGAKPAAGA